MLIKKKSLGTLSLAFALLISLCSFGQSMMVKGKVVDEKGIPLIGVTIIELGVNNGAATDFDGNYVLNVQSESASLVVSYVGYQTQTVEVSGKSTVNVIMAEDLESLEEVQVVAFSKQKKNSVIGSISTVKASDLKIPSSNLTTAFAGKIAGLISYQRSGEPGADNAEFFIRGVTTFGYKNNPLILLDGLEITTSDLARLEPDNIATFSIMKDATATSLYGARGANGVILVTTKEGKKGKARVSFRYENSFSAPSQTPEFLGAVDYMRMYNQAQRMRDQSALLKYSIQQITGTEQGLNPELYPDVDRHNELFKDYTLNKKLNLTFQGVEKLHNTICLYHTLTKLVC